MNEEAQHGTEEPAEVKNANRLLTWGLILSGLYISALAIYAAFVWQAMLKMTPDQTATFLSGMFAPLAFLWLVLGFKQQGDELQNSARALWLQGEELRNSVEQQRQLVNVARDQLSADYSKALAAEEEAERASQPFLTASVGGAYMGEECKFNFYIINAGPSCTDARLYLNGQAFASQPLFKAEDRLGSSTGNIQTTQVAPALLRIEYTDLRGRRRAQEFSVDIDPTGGPNERPSFRDAVKVNGIIKLEN